MALVYRVEQLDALNNLEWALKVLRPPSGKPTDLDEARRLFHQEAALLQRLSHPHLPRVVAAFDEGDQSYMVMEFIEGQTLHKHLQTAHGPLPEKAVLRWMLQVCDLLDYLHNQPEPIIFRDLKPDNIMLAPSGIKLIDFGIARTYKKGKRHDTIKMGSENYAPPEQWDKHRQTDARSDVYALGATMYHLLTNTLPVIAVAPDPLPPPRTVVPALSAPTEAVILKAMAKEPDGRYQTAKAMQQALEASLGSLGGSVVVALQPVATAGCPHCGQANRQGARFCGRCGCYLGGPLHALVQIIVGGGGGHPALPLSKLPFLIGRTGPQSGLAPELDLTRYDDSFASRRHAQIAQQGSDFTLTDLDSANGTFVNGVRLAPHEARVLRSGDRITIGKVHLIFSIST